MKVAAVQPRPVSWTCHQVAPLLGFFFFFLFWWSNSQLCQVSAAFVITSGKPTLSPVVKNVCKLFIVLTLSLSVSLFPSHSFLILIHAPHLRPHSACMVIRARLFARTSLSTFAPTFLD